MGSKIKFYIHNIYINMDINEIKQHNEAVNSIQHMIDKARTKERRD